MRAPTLFSCQRSVIRVLSTCAALASTWVFAGGPTSWAVLVGGGRDPSDGVSALAALESAVEGGRVHLGFVNEYPRVARTDDLRGMSAGLHVTVLGVCGVESEALAARDAARVAFPGAYVKPIDGGLALGCPIPLAPPQDAMLGPTVAVVAPRDRLGLQLRVLHSPTAGGDRCPADSLWVELARERQRGPALVHDRLAFKGACRTERQGQVTATSHLYERSVDGPDVKVHLVQELASGKGGRSHLRLHGVWACGGELRSRALLECTGGTGAPCSFDVSERPEGLQFTTFAGCAPGTIPSAASCAVFTTTPVRLDGCAVLTAERAPPRATP